QRIDAYDLELAEHGEAVERDQCANERGHRVESVEPRLAVIQSRLARGDVNRDAQRIDHLNVVGAPPRRLADAVMAVESGIGREPRDSHRGSSTGGLRLGSRFMAAFCPAAERTG